ncbi:MAG: rhodanese-like domain-containing protein [Paracoccaceae bacterium]
MPKTVKDMLAEANAAAEKITPARGMELIAKGALVIDVRDGTEVAASGKVKGALHVNRGLLEFKADDGTAYHDPAFSKDRPVITYCAAGGRAALAAKTLKDMGYAEVYHMGGFKDWVEAGGETDPPA